jgi:hypothetical protein
MDATHIEQAIATLRARVPLAVPRRSIPGLSVTGSTLHFAGWDTYERRDAWRDDEVGHGDSGGTETTLLSRQALWRDLEALPAEQVTPVVPRPQESARVLVSELVPLLLSGAVVVRGWSEPAQSDLLLGHDGGLLWMRLGTKHVQAVERWEPSRLDAIHNLSFPRSAVSAADPTAAALATEAQARLARHAGLVEQLRQHPATYVPGILASRVKTGTCFDWLLFEDNPAAERARVVGLTDSEGQRLLAAALANDPQVAPALLVAGSLARVAQAEQALFEVKSQLLEGKLRFRVHNRVNGHHCWLGGVGHEVDEVAGQAVPLVRRNADLQPDLSALAALLLAGERDRLQPLTDEWRARVLAAPLLR